MVIKGKHLLIVLILVLLLAGAGVVLYFHLRPTDENRIRDLCSTFTSQISKSTGEGAIPAAARAKSISTLFTEKSQFSVDGLPWASAPRSREKLSADIFRSRAMFDRISLSFEDLELQIQPGNTKAHYTLTAVLRGTMKSGKDLYEVRNLEGDLVKLEGKWLFTGFRVRKLIRQ